MFKNNVKITERVDFYSQTRKNVINKLETHFFLFIKQSICSKRKSTLYISDVTSTS